VKATLWEEVPRGGAVPIEVKVNVPATEAEPPVSVELAKVCPRRSGEAEGAREMEVGALLTVTEMVVVAVIEVVVVVEDVEIDIKKQII
jgi:hypothetical protein